jgi:hypothetical protein
VTASAVLAELHALGVVATVRGENLALRPAAIIPARLLAEAQACKSEVLALLADKDQTPMPPMMPYGFGGGSYFLHDSIADDDCDAPSIRAEPPLPAPGTPERAAHDRRHERMCAGLLAQWQRHHRPAVDIARLAPA